MSTSDEFDIPGKGSEEGYIAVKESNGSSEYRVHKVKVDRSLCRVQVDYIGSVAIEHDWRPNWRVAIVTERQLVLMGKFSVCTSSHSEVPSVLAFVNIQPQKLQNILSSRSKFF